MIHKETVTPKVEPNIETEVPLAQAQTSNTSAIKETTEEPKDEVDESSKTDNDQIENKIDSEVIATEELASVDAISEEDKEKEATDAKKDNVENVFEETPGNLNKNFVYLEYIICFFCLFNVRMYKIKSETTFVKHKNELEWNSLCISLCILNRREIQFPRYEESWFP